MAAALQNQRNLIFASVFPFAAAAAPDNHAAAVAAPSPADTTNFATPTSHHHHHVTRSHDHHGRPSHHHGNHPASSHAKHTTQRNVAWNTATRFLKLPDALPQAGHAHTPRVRKHRLNADVEEALRFLLVDGDGALLEGGAQRGGEGASAQHQQQQQQPPRDLVEWYTNEARENFIACVRPVLQAKWQSPIPTAQASTVLEETVNTLRQAQLYYFQHLDDHMLCVLRSAAGDEHAARVAAKFRRDLHAIVLHALPQQRFSKTLSYVLYDAGCKLFGISDDDVFYRRDSEADEGQNVRQHVAALLHALEEVGLGGDQAQRAAAQAMDKLMDAFIGSHHMKVDWYGKKPMTRTLREWVKDGFSPLVREILSCLTGEENVFLANEVQQWTDMAIGRLGRARVENLFDYVVNWDRSLGAILDLKEYITTPAARNHLTNSFLQQIIRRLLHAGATTTHILDTYIYVIRAFIELDSKGILLEKVARPIRRYLRDREDTARIIVSSLLADIEDEAGNRLDLGPDISVEIAAEMLNPVASNVQEEDQDLNWGDMSWMPDPVDASPEYKKAKSENVLIYLLSLYDREDFITELKNILGEHLLKNENSEFEKEIRLLELFKVRLGDNNLQACEVMLKDALESKRMNKQIHHILQQQSDVYRDIPTELNSQILSSFFWPSLREEEFHLPAPVQKLMKEYEAGFESIKDMRKLHWFPALGRVAVALEFDDRNVELEVLPWQAAVIYAFQEGGDDAEDEDEDAGLDEKERQRRARLRAVGAAETPGRKRGKKPPVTKTVEQLEQQLEMEESLLRSALVFWVGQRVLTETSPDTFAVLETLSDTDPDAEEAAAAAAEAAAEAEQHAIKSAEDVLVENMQMYRQFVMGMLTNQGRMGADRVCGMLKMALAGGFPFGVDEVRLLLGRMVEEGVLVQAGDGFAVKK